MHADGGSDCGLHWRAVTRAFDHALDASPVLDGEFGSLSASGQGGLDAFAQQPGFSARRPVDRLDGHVGFAGDRLRV